MRARGLLVCLGLLVSAGWGMDAPTAVAAGGSAGRGEGKKVTLLTRNLYLGADLLPAIEAIAQGDFDGMLTEVGTVWAKVQATDFSTRAVALADEIKRGKPDLVGLQECETWSVGAPFDPAPADTVVYDYLALLLGELEARGAHYDVAVAVDDYSAEFPGYVPASPYGVLDIAMHERDVLLVRREADLKLSNRVDGNFETNLFFEAFGAEFTILRGWARADVRAGDREFRVVTTHLESDHPGVRFAQAAEILAGPCDTTLPTILIGDMNSDGNGGSTSAAYDLFATAGFGDAWTATHGDDPGITWGHDELLANPVPFSTTGVLERIDFVLFRGDISAVSADRLGEATEDRYGGLWPSDHAGVIATLRVR